eukprot:1808077-Rhodomonas_salina.1
MRWKSSSTSGRVTWEVSRTSSHCVEATCLAQLVHHFSMMCDGAETGTGRAEEQPEMSCSWSTTDFDCVDGR